MDKEQQRTMEELVEDPNFREYHRQQMDRRRGFNAFDVLRYADYEIRHSNVVAWLLQPSENHGVGSAFLDWFMGRLDRPPRDYDLERVRVERELHYVDITVFLEGEWGSCVVAVENKVGGASQAAVDQIRGYVATLEEEGHSDVRGVLMSTSREGSVQERGISHVSWSDIRAEIERLEKAGKFASEEVAAFVRQYVEAVGRFVAPRGSDEHFFRRLLGEHGALLERLRDVLVKEGDGGVRELVPESGQDYRDSVVRLVKDFRQEPVRLRSAVRDYLDGRGIGTTIDSRGTNFWLMWDLEAAEELDIQGCRWVLTFKYRSLTVHINVPPWCSKGATGGTWERIKSFMRKVPVDRRFRERYPMRGAGYGYYTIYHHQLLGDDVLSALSASEVRDRTLAEVKRFLDSDTSDYRRINDYFRCLSFRPDAATSA